MTDTSTQVRLARRPQGSPVDDWQITTGPVPVPVPGEGEVLLQTLHVSLDPPCAAG